MTAAVIREPRSSDASSYHRQFRGMLVEGQVYAESVFLVRADITVEQLNWLVDQAGLRHTGKVFGRRYFAASDYLKLLHDIDEAPGKYPACPFAS